MKTVEIRGRIVSNDDASMYDLYKSMYDWFNVDYTSPAAVFAAVDSLDDGEELTVIINSGGGDVFSGQEMYSMLKKASASHKITVEVLSIAASAASIIAMAGGVVKMSPSSELMIHNASTVAAGDYREMLQTAEVLQAIDDSIRQAYSLKTGMTDEELKPLMDEETWFPAKRCLKDGFADEIICDEKKRTVTNSIVEEGSIFDNLVTRAKIEMKKQKETKNEKDEILDNLYLYGF